jgi:hypothetical protein
MQFIPVYETSYTETVWKTNGNFHYVGGQNEQGFTRSYLVQPEDQKHWSYAEWLWMEVTSLHPRILDELRSISQYTVIVHDDRFTDVELLEVSLAAVYLRMGGEPEEMPRPEPPMNWMELAQQVPQPSTIPAIV